MTRMPTTDDNFDRAMLKQAANDLTNGLIAQLHDIRKHTTQESLKGVRQRGQTVLNMTEAAEVVRTVHGFAYMTSRRLQQIASLTQLGEGAGDKPKYLVLRDREGPGCAYEVVCIHKLKRLHTECEKAFAGADQPGRQFFQNESPNGKRHWISGWWPRS
jgi:hypothetical protein